MIEYGQTTLTEETITAFPSSQNIAIKDFYESDIIINNTIKTYKDLFISKPDFTNGEFAIIIFKKDETEKYILEETYILKYDQKSEIEVYNDSDFIYLKLNSNTEKVDTKDYSIEELTIQVDTTQDYSDIEHYSRQELINSSNIFLDKDYFTVDYLLGFKCSSLEDSYDFDIMTNIAKERGNTIALNSVWEESNYLGKTESEILTQITNDFGCQDFRYNAKVKVFNDYMSMFGNMKLQYDFYNENYIWLPIIGDVAGSFVENESITGVGYNTIFKNTDRLLFNITDIQNKKDLNRNGINLVTYNNLAQAIIFDSITSTQDMDSIFRELQKRKTLNMIKNDLRRFFFSQLLKLLTSDRVSDINTLLDNYLNKLYKNGKITRGYSKDVQLSGSVMNISLKFTFTDILRVVNISIIVNESGVEIREI